jgi:hypothetical protein
MQIVRARWSHSLALGALLSLTMILVACGDNSTATSPYTADELIQKANTNFAQDGAIHFTLAAKNIPPGLFSIIQAEGDVVRPDKLQLSGADFISTQNSPHISIIFVGGNQYVDLTGTGTNYSKTNALPNLLNIFSSTEGIGAILLQVQQPSKPTADTVNSVACWKVNGTVASSLLAPITGGNASTSTPVQAQMWIGQSDLQIHQVTLIGKAVDGDQDNTTRTFVLSKFNESITITPPPTK